MSDRCLGWRMLLSRRADGDLSRYEWEALDDHLGGCRDCRLTAQSDRMLHLALTGADFAIDPNLGRRLDDHILLALGIPERLTFGQRCGRGLRELWARWEAVPNLYLTQIAGGTLAAASLTAVFLLTALHPIEDTVHAAGEVRRINAGQVNHLPVPLESLLEQPSPRAAFLWTAPSLMRPLRGAKPLLPSIPSAPSTPQSSDPPPHRHGSLAESLFRG
jgi:hypothetical protein